MADNILVKFIQDNRHQNAGEYHSFPESYADKLFAAGKVEFPDPEDDEEAKEILARHRRRSAAKLRARAATEAKNRKTLEEGEAFLKDNPDYKPPKTKAEKKADDEADAKKKSTRKTRISVDG